MTAIRVVADRRSEAGESIGSPDRQPYSAEKILRAGWRRRWQIVLPAVLLTGAAAYWIHRLPDRYRSDALLLMVPQRVPETFVRSTVAIRSENRLQSVTQQILSRTQLETIIRDLNLYADRREKAAMQDVVDAMRTRDIDVQPVKGEALRLGFISENPMVAQQVAGRLASLFVGQSSLDRSTLAENADKFLEAQLEDVRRKLVDNEAKVEEYRRHHNGELPRQLEANVQGLHGAEMQMQALADSLNRDRERQLVLERSIKDANLLELVEGAAPPRTRSRPPDTSKPDAAEQLERAEASLRDMQATMTEQHPDVVAMKETVARLRSHAAAAVESARPIESVEAIARRSRVEGLQAELAGVEQQIARKTADGERLRTTLLGYQRRIESEPTREAEFAALTRDYDTLQQTYRGLLAKKQESEISANLERQQIGAHFKVLDPARLPERPFAPNRPRLYALTSCGSAAVGILLAALLEWFDRGLRTEDDVTAALGLPVLATIPSVDVRRRRAS